MEREQTTIRLPVELKEQLQQEADRQETIKTLTSPRTEILSQAKEICETMDVLEVAQKLISEKWLAIGAFRRGQQFLWILIRICD